MALPMKGFKVKIDVITANLIVVASLLFTFSMTWGDVLSVIAGVLLFGGATLAIFFHTLTFDLFLSKKELRQTMAWVIACMGVILITNYAVQKASPFGLAENLVMFGVLIAVAEEVFFGIYLTPWLFRMTRNPLPAIFLTAITFTVYHFNVYGTDLNALIIVFGGRIILSLSILQTARATASTVSHSLTNFISTLFTIV